MERHMNYMLHVHPRSLLSGSGSKTQQTKKRAKKERNTNY